MENNPYRVLGVYVGAPKSVELRNINRIRAFSKVDQTAEFELRGDDRLAPLHRTEAMAEEAAQALSLPRDRVTYGLMWFSDGTEPWGRALNAAVDALIDHDYTTALQAYEQLISDPTMREAFLEASGQGLIKMTREDLATLISEQINKYDERLADYWLKPGQKPTGLIAQILFEKSITPRLEKLKDELECKNGPGCMSGTVYNIYDFLDHFHAIAMSLRPVCEACANVYGKDNYRYQCIAEDMGRVIYNRGKFILNEIGKLVWVQGKCRDTQGIYKMYKSKMPTRYIRACMDLMRRADDIVAGSIAWLEMDDVSVRSAYEVISDYQTAKQNQLVDDDEIIRHSNRSFYTARCATIALWLAFLAFLYI